MYQKTIQAVEMFEGAGARVKRLFPLSRGDHYDPFILMDHFFVSPPAGFPTHPHRGFEAITYLFRGKFHHKDNLGNDSWVNEGGIQRFTAGSGLEHSEMPGEEEAEGIQLWMNLPLQDKEVSPSYQGVSSGEIREEVSGQKKIRWIKDQKAVLKLRTKPEIFHAFIPAGEGYEFSLAVMMSGIVYVRSGEITDSSGHSAKAGEAMFYKDLENLELKASQDTEIFSFFGNELKQPIRLMGPFVL